MLTNYWVILHQDHAVRIVTTVLLGYIGVASASSGLHLDDWTDVLVFLSHDLSLRFSRHEQ